jgi:hypothetical protein
MIPVEFTVGRHTAGDGAGVDPIVAAALRRRPTSVELGAPRHGPESRRHLTGVDGEGGLGWPGEPHTGTGLGWPVDLVPAAAPAVAEPAATLVTDEAPVRRRLGWRRIFGGGAGAAPRDSSAA